MYPMYVNDMNCDIFFKLIEIKGDGLLSSPPLSTVPVQKTKYIRAPPFDRMLNQTAFSAQIISFFLRQMALSAAAATVKRC